MKKLITEVAGWKIGDEFFHDVDFRNQSPIKAKYSMKYIIISFPSKKTVVGRLTADTEFPITCKISICDLILENGSKNKHRCPNG